MYSIKIPKDNYTDLEPNDLVKIENTEYIIKRVKKGGMGKICFLEKKINLLSYEMHYPQKLVLKGIYNGEDKNNDIIKEIKKWGTLKHENISEFIGLASLKENKKVIASCYVDYEIRYIALLPSYECDLEEYCKSYKLTLHENLQLILQIISGLNYAYNSHKMLHLDLKPQNVLINILQPLSKNSPEIQEVQIKISDWGLAEEISCEDQCAKWCKEIDLRHDYTKKINDLFFTTKNTQSIKTYDGKTLYTFGEPKDYLLYNKIFSL
mgnify:CR=1 FL=1